MNFESKIRRQIVKEIDDLFESLCDHNFKPLTEKDNDISDDECDEIESIFMSYRNVVAGTEWDGQKQEYEKYKVKG